MGHFAISKQRELRWWLGSGGFGCEVGEVEMHHRNPIAVCHFGGDSRAVTGMKIGAGAQ